MLVNVFFLFWNISRQFSIIQMPEKVRFFPDITDFEW